MKEHVRLLGWLVAAGLGGYAAGSAANVEAAEPEFAQVLSKTDLVEGLPLQCRPAESCCKICSRGQACGDTCISREKNCHVGKGCACDAAELCE